MAYVNVHTTMYPNGNIRGQISHMPMPMSNMMMAPTMAPMPMPMAPMPMMMGPMPMPGDPMISMFSIDVHQFSVGHS